MTKRHTTGGRALESIVIMKHLKKEKFNVLPALQRVQHWWRAFRLFFAKWYQRIISIGA